jgi:ABC-type antimicrobial peptide transport system permease subunit
MKTAGLVFLVIGLCIFFTGFFILRRAIIQVTPDDFSGIWPAFQWADRLMPFGFAVGIAGIVLLVVSLFKHSKSQHQNAA